jgi:hypothetical protein
LVNTDPDFVSKYDVIVANNLSTATVSKLSDACVKHKKVLVTLRSNGMLGIVRLYKGEHRVVEKKSDTLRWDLRLFDPWKELEEYCMSFDMEVSWVFALSCFLRLSLLTSFRYIVLLYFRVS